MMTKDGVVTIAEPNAEIHSQSITVPEAQVESVELWTPANRLIGPLQSLFVRFPYI